MVTTGSLKSGGTRSCGCLQRTSSKRFGHLRRTIDYSAVRCHVCGKSLANRFLAEDGSRKKPLCEVRLDNLVCRRCHGNIARRNGRRTAEKNSNINLNEIHKDAIIGSVLGDGNLEQSPGGRLSNYGLTVKHGLKQEKYCLWKAFLLGDLVSKVDYPDGRVRFRTVKHGVISRIAARMSKNGRKAVDERFVSRMGPLGFAIWYLDDGNLLPNRVGKNGKTRKPEIRFATNSFTEEENLVLRKILEKRVGVKTTKCQWITHRSFGGVELPEPKRFYGIRLYGENAEKFLDFIRPHVDWKASGMGYKADTTLRGPLDNKHTRRRKS